MLEMLSKPTKQSADNVVTESLFCDYIFISLNCKNVQLISRFLLQGEKISTILKAAKVTVEPFWPGLFSKALTSCNVKDLITTVGSGVGTGPAAAAALPTLQNLSI